MFLFLLIPSSRSRFVPQSHSTRWNHFDDRLKFMIGTNLVQQPGSTNNLVQQTTCFTNLVQQTTTRSTFLLITFNIDHVQHFVQHLTLFRSTFMYFVWDSLRIRSFDFVNMRTFFSPSFCCRPPCTVCSSSPSSSSRVRAHHLAPCSFWPSSPCTLPELRAGAQSTLAKHAGRARWLRADQTSELAQRR